jgi:hypothetical protein
LIIGRTPSRQVRHVRRSRASIFRL